MKKNNSVSKNNFSTVKILKQIFEWSFNIICLVLVILALLMAIASISRTKDKNSVGVASLGNITYAPVASDSMQPTIMVGDLAVGRKYKGQELCVGDIITFRTSVSGKVILNTHRIVKIVKSNDGSIGYVYTKGDNVGQSDQSPVLPQNILSVYQKSYKGLGKPILWLQEDAHNFFLGVVLPIIILFVIYAVIFIRALVNAALGKKRLAAATVDGLSEEDKKKLAEEYLAKLESEKHQKADDVVALSDDSVKQVDAKAITDTNKDETVDNTIQDDSQKQEDTNTQDSVVDNKEDSKTAEDSSSNK